VAEDGRVINGNALGGILSRSDINVAVSISGLRAYGHVSLGALLPGQTDGHHRSGVHFNGRRSISQGSFLRTWELSRNAPISRAVLHGWLNTHFSGIMPQTTNPILGWIRTPVSMAPGDPTPVVMHVHSVAREFEGEYRLCGMNILGDPILLWIPASGNNMMLHNRRNSWDGDLGTTGNAIRTMTTVTAGLTLV
jgi:hypothetical protein